MRKSSRIRCGNRKKTGTLGLLTSIAHKELNFHVFPDKKTKKNKNKQINSCRVLAKKLATHNLVFNACLFQIDFFVIKIPPFVVAICCWIRVGVDSFLQGIDKSWQFRGFVSWAFLLVQHSKSWFFLLKHGTRAVFFREDVFRKIYSSVFPRSEKTFFFSYLCGRGGEPPPPLAWHENVMDG